MPPFSFTLRTRRLQAAAAVLVLTGLLVGSVAAPVTAQEGSTTTTPSVPTTTPPTSTTTTTLPGSPPVTADPSPPPMLPPNPELDGLRDRQNESSEGPWSIRYSDAELELWAGTLNQIVVEKQTNVASLQGELTRAQDEVKRLNEVIRSIEREIAALEEVVRGRVVEAYMASGAQNAAASMLLQSSNPVDMEFRRFLVSVATKSDRDVLDQLTSRKAAARDERQRVEKKEREITELKTAADRELAELESVKTDLDALRTAIETRAGDIRREVEALAAEEGILRRILGYPDDSNVPTTVVRPVSSEGLIWPAVGTLTSVFGMRWGVLHAGIDLGAPTGTPIYAAAAGTVIFSGPQGGYGNIVIIDHGYGFHTAYAHMSRTIAVNGSRVLRGELIGLIGSTGNSTGPHLHFETRVFGRPYDPLQYLPVR